MFCFCRSTVVFLIFEPFFVSNRQQKHVICCWLVCCTCWTHEFGVCLVPASADLAITMFWQKPRSFFTCSRSACVHFCQSIDDMLRKLCFVALNPWLSSPSLGLETVSAGLLNLVSFFDHNACAGRFIEPSMTQISRFSAMEVGCRGLASRQMQKKEAPVL